MIALDDVRYGEAGGRALLLDLRRPDPLPASPAPVLVWIHGGGWEAGDRRDDILGPMGAAPVGAGFVTVSIDYRLSDEACFPAQIHDAKAAIRWLRANAAELGIDP